MPTLNDDALAATLAASSAGGPPFERGERVGTGRFVVGELLGEGTFGWVFSATRATSALETSLSDVMDQTGPVALKVLRPEHARVDSIFARFKRRELEVLRRVHAGGHAPNVVRALDADIFTERGFAFIVLELIEGPTLTDVISKERVLDPSDAREIGAGIARGIAAIHAVGGVHRDLKPDNIRLRRGTDPVILDLGIAKAMWETQTLTGTNQGMMTPFYAAPEQLAGKEVGASCDVYSLGLIMYEMQAGHVPLAGRTFAETLQARNSRTPPDPRAHGRPLPDDLVAVTLRCLERDPTKRPSAADVASLLGAVVRPQARSRRSFVVGASIAGLAVVGGMAVAAVAYTSKSDTPTASASTTATAPAGSVSAPVASTAPSSTTSASAAPSSALPASNWLTIDLPKPRFTPGEKVQLRVVSGRRAYVMLLGIDEDGSATVLLPRRGREAPRIEAGDGIDFPSDDDRRVGFQLIAQLPPKEVSTRERIVAIAIEDKRDFIDVVPAGAAASDALAMRRAQAEALLAKVKALVTGHAVTEVAYEISRVR